MVGNTWGRVKGVSILVVLTLFLVALQPWFWQASANAQESGGPAEAVSPLELPFKKKPSFYFVHLTDTHVGSRSGSTNTPVVLDEIARLDPEPAFVVNSGDLVELGSPSEYGAYRDMIGRIPFRVHNALGNHESRWLDAGKERFRSLFGSPYYSFDRGDVHFVVLDTSIPAGSHGHFERTMLEWLSKDLNAQGYSKPIVIFAHHPICFEAKCFNDNDYEFLESIRPYNVRAVFVGHGHLDLNWAVNGVQFFMTAAGMDLGYKVVGVTDESLEVFKKVSGGFEFVASVPLERPRAAKSFKMVSPEAGEVAGEVGAEIRVEVSPVGIPEPYSLQYRWDTGPWNSVPGERVSRVGDRVGWRVSSEGLYEGLHVLYVRALTAEEGVWVDSRRLRLIGPRKDDGLGGLAWYFDAGSSIQGKPVLKGSTVYFTSQAGNLFALDSATGTLRWSVDIGGAGVAGPAPGGDRIFTATTSGVVKAFDAQDGRELWARSLDDSIVATPLERDGFLYVASMNGYVYAFDSSSGRLLWKANVGSPVRARPEWGEGRLYVGSWGLSLVSLDAKTGDEVWRRELARQVYYAPGAAASPLYAAGRVFVTSHADPYRGGFGLHALDALTGDILWQAKVNCGFSSPVWLSHLGEVAVSTNSGEVVFLDPVTGESVRQIKSGLATYEGGICAFGDDVILASLWGTVCSLGSSTSQENWRVSVGNGFILAPAAVSADMERIFVGSMDGFLYCIAAAPTQVPEGQGPCVPPPGEGRGERDGELELILSDLSGHWAEQSVEKLARMGVVNGYPDGTFRPDGDVLRAEACAMIARFLRLDAPDVPQGPTDFDDLEDHWALRWIRALEARGLVAGYRHTLKDGTTRLLFLPDQRLSRAESATLMLRILRFKGDTSASAGNASDGRDRGSPDVVAGQAGSPPAFRDVRGHWAEDAVRELARMGLVAGYKTEEGTVFRPDAPITRAELATMLSRIP